MNQDFCSCMNLQAVVVCGGDNSAGSAKLASLGELISIGSPRAEASAYRAIKRYSGTNFASCPKGSDTKWAGPLSPQIRELYYIQKLVHSP